MSLDIRGFLETSLIDWDGKICAVIFLPNCNFRCPFCHNGPLILDPKNLKKFEFSDIKTYLLEHKTWIDGVVITGGEPTIHKELEKFIKSIKDMGFLIKLDTNGTNPEMLEQLLKNKLIDYVAMDIKAPLNNKYEKLAGAGVDLDNIRKSIGILKNSGLGYEFRTTVVPGLLDIEDINEMAKQLPSSSKFVLQQFQPDNSLDENFRQKKPFNKEKFSEIQEFVKKIIPNTILRGI